MVIAPAGSVTPHTATRSGYPSTRSGAVQGLGGRLSMLTDYHNHGVLQTMTALPTAPAVPCLPYAGGSMPGIGGQLKMVPEDFVVEEVPLYAPDGNGEHLYLWIEKRGVPTEAVAQELRRAFGVPPAAIGTAGKKDARAVARQWFSVHTAADPDAALLGDSRWRVLEVSRHRNKLRTGHLRGNRFTITVREVRRVAGVELMLERLSRGGFPNYFGPQRLGAATPPNGNAIEGRRLLRRERAFRGPVEGHRFAVNAYQAALFNLIVARRLNELGNLGTLLPGDWALLHSSGAAFPVTEDSLVETQERADLRELNASAPLFGTRVDLASGRAGAWEQALLARESLAPESFRLGGKRLSPKGERRAVRAFPEGLQWQWRADRDQWLLHLEFLLSRGVYATSLLREVMRNDTLLPLCAPKPRPNDQAPA